MIRSKRVYEAPDGPDGTRILVDRLWPRGLTRSRARVDEWRKDVAPSDALRRWFGHDPGRWSDFVRRHSAELDARPESWRPILERAREEKVTFLFAARDAEHNNAVALAHYLSARLARGRRHPRGVPVRRSSTRQER
jgi:uncharacterized protein YeaO (DUF488 family)